MILTKRLSLPSEGGFHTLNITEQLRAVVRDSGVREGQALVFYRHTTGCVIIAEHEAGSMVDLENLLEAVSPVAGNYRHHQRGWDRNGAAHLRAALMGVSVTIPVVDGDLDLGTWQEVLVIDFDSGAKTRTLTVQVSGE